MMYSIIILDDDKPSEKPKILQGENVFMLCAKKAEDHYENSAALLADDAHSVSLEMFANLGAGVRTLIETAYPPENKTKKAALKAFAKGFNKKAGRTEITGVEREGKLNE